MVESLRFLNRQVVSTVVAGGMLFAMLIPTIMPVMASADAITQQSIEMSSATADAAAVSYDLKFHSSQAAGAYVIDFCEEAVVGTTCTPPTGLLVTSATTATADTTAAQQTSDTTEHNTVVVVQTVGANSDTEVVLTGIHNPSDVATFYARIISYDTSVHAQAYAPATLGTGAKDGGSIALATSSTIGVSAAVRESLVFCVASADISGNCANAAANTPNVTLGSDGALDSSRVDTGSIYTQITTNAAHGAVVNIKSDATGCGGLKLFGGSSCIAPAAADDDFVDALVNTALFGVKVGTGFATTAGGAVAGATGTIQAADGSDYTSSKYTLGYASNNETGVTSPYGDPILDTNDLPVNNQNMQLTFGAGINSNTPAGNYTAKMNMIATGKF
jgi:hypothetical protein